jgi:hypothetical protein
MAWGSNTNQCTIGDATKKAVYDDLWDKLQYVRTDVVPANGKMLQGASTAWVGWTKDTATWTNDSMIVFTTGSIGSGGSDSPSAAHSHSLPNHTHPLDHVTDGQSSSGTWGDTITEDDIANPGGAGSTGNHTPKYQTVIAATKDTYA